MRSAKLVKRKKSEFETSIRSKFYQIKQNKFSEIFSNPIVSTSVIFVVLSLFISLLTIPLFEGNLTDYYRSILIEAHGMLFDVGIIGILLYWLNNRGEKKILIKRYQDEIDDIRLWKSEEASFKILGNVKRLLREKVMKLDLHHCYLRNINLSLSDLHESNLNNTDFSNSILNETNFKGSRMNYINMEGCTLNKAIFESCYLNAANLSGIKGIKTVFRNSMLIKADLRDAFLIEPDFKGSDLSGANFENASLFMANFIGSTGLSPEQFSNVKNLDKVKMDEELRARICDLYPYMANVTV